MNHQRLRTFWTCGTVFLVGSLAACVSVGPDYETPSLDAPPSWTRQLEGGLQNADLAPMALSKWWNNLEDAALSGLIEEAVGANLDLRKAESQLRQARAERSRSRSLFFPNLGFSSSSAEQGRIDGGGPDSSSELYTNGFDASWEIDVFGGLRRANEAATAEQQAAVEGRRDVLISVLAEVALNYVELRTLQTQLAIAQRNLRIQEQARDVVVAQVEQGLATDLERQQALANAAKTRSTIPTLSQTINEAKNRLCLLVGKPPGALNATLDAHAPVAAPTLEVVLGVPADVMRRRPDVRVSERRLAAETARLGVAKAELYPKFILNGSIGIESTSLAGLGGIYSFGPQIQWPIFSAGRIRREIEIQGEVQEQALIAYEATLLGALEDVENSIVAFGEERLRLEALRESADAARNAASTATARYEAGMSPFLEVLDAQRTQLAAEDAVASSEGTLLSNLIRLYKALGGGWESLPPVP